MEHPTLADFLQRAIVWPDPNSETGWVNLHWRMPDRKGITGGQAFKTLEQVLGFIRWSQSKGKGKVTDLYYCTSLQAVHGDVKPSGRYSAERSIDNAVSSRLLFADVDKYPTKEAAAADIIRFCQSSLSPFPTALVDSGGGLHAYWILPEPFEKEQWLELACKFDGLLNQYGLKHDNISTDMARILRPPETLNYKRSPLGDPVVLKLLNGDIDLDGWKSLLAATPTPALARASQGSSSVPIEHLFVNPQEINKGPSSFFNGKIPLSEQIGEGVLDPSPVLQLCPMFSEAFATGGQKVSQPVWHQQALACTFFTEGRELFHDLGRKHVGYSPSSSDEMYDRKIRDRAAKGLGYPSCAAFERDGSEQCRTCPIRGKVTSPLNIDSAMMRAAIEAAQRKADGPPVVVPDNAAEISLPADKPAMFDTTPPDNRLPLPRGFKYDDEGFINFLEKDGKATIDVPLVYSKFLEAEPFIESDSNGLALWVRLTSTGGIPREVMIPNDAFGDPARLTRLLEKGGCVMATYEPSKLTKLMLNFRGRMSLEKLAARAVPFGWEYAERTEGEDQGHPIGFAYGDSVYAPGGKVRKTFGGDPKLKETYSVNGKPEPWVRAVRTILRMKSPGLQTVVLSAFAAPLMIFTGQPSTVVMVRGQSGGSKSTASAIACAVWARPRTAMLKPSSSKLGIMKRMGRIKHLPTIWDDIRNEQFETVKDTLMEITQGGEGLKLDQNRDEREQGIWDNMLLTTSNNSLVEYLEEISKNDGAALVRCFEFEVPKITATDKAYEDPNQVAELIASLDFNCGYAGREYAMVLGSDPVALQDMYKQVAERFSKRIAPYQPNERFWLAACATIMMAGILANDLAIMKSNSMRFALDDIETFLVETYRELRTRHANANLHADASNFSKHYLSQFFNSWAAQRNETVWTVEAPTKPGKPALSAPIWPIGDEARRMKQVSVRWVTSDKKLRISKAALERFLRQEKVSVDRVTEGLRRFYKAKMIRARIAGGLSNIAAQGIEPVYEIDVQPGTWLDDILKQHVTDVDSQKIVPLQPSQSPGQPEPRHQAGQTDPEDGTDAS